MEQPNLFSSDNACNACNDRLYYILQHYKQLRLGYVKMFHFSKMINHRLCSTDTLWLRAKHKWPKTPQFFLSHIEKKVMFSVPPCCGMNKYDVLDKFFLVYVFKLP